MNKATFSTKYKTENLTIKEKNNTIDRIFKLIFSRTSFLLLGHKHADEDCIASLVALALLLKKFNKTVYIFLEDNVPKNLSFFMDMCSYNNITVFIKTCFELISPQTVFILDTAKPEMIAICDSLSKFMHDTDIPKVELDHHFITDASYSGDEGYRLTIRASSTCEIIALLCLKLEKQPVILKKYGISNLYSRNIVLAMVTGMVGDAKMGNYLFKRRDKAFYEYFLTRFNKILNTTFYKNTKNISSVEQVLSILESLSAEDNALYQKVIASAIYKGKIGIIVLDKNIAQLLNTKMEYNQFLGVIKKATDTIAENAKGIGISVYIDPPEISDKIQFRVRASQLIKGIDLRPLLKAVDINDGGGHPGAIGFRFPSNEIKNINSYVDNLVQKIESLFFQNE